MEKKKGLFTKDFVKTLIIVACVVVPMTYCMPLLPIFISSTGGNTAMAGLVVSIFNVTSMICRPFSAYLIDNHRKKPIFIAAFAAIAVGCFFYRFAAAAALLLVLRMVHAVGYSAGSNAAGVVAAGVLPEDKRRDGLGYYGFAISAAIALGPTIALAVMELTGVEWAFTVASMIALFGLVLLITVKFDDVQPAHKTKFSLRNCYEVSAIPLTLVMCITFFAYSGLATFLSVYTISLGLGNMNIAFYLALAVGMIVSKAASEVLFRGKDSNAVLLPASIVAMLLGLFILSAAHTAALLIITALLFGLGFGTLQAGLLSTILSECPPQRRGAANSTFLSSGDVGMAVGPVVWGAVADRMGFSMIYRLGAVCMLGALALLIIVLRKRKKA